MSLRTILGVAFGALATLLLGTAVALGLVATYLHRVARDLDIAVQGVGAAGDIELDLMAHSRASNQTLAPGAPAPIFSPAQLERSLQRRLAQARTQAATPAEVEAVREVTERIDDYLAARRTAAARHLSLPATLALTTPRLDAAVLALQGLVKLTTGVARTAHLRARRWDRIAKALSITLVALAVLTVIWSLIGLQRRVYRPMTALRAAIGRFSAGDHAARAPATGPAEVREIAERFNGMADALAQQEEQRLAFLGGVAHDLRNPLTALRLSLDIVRPGEPLPPERQIRDTLALLARQLRRMERMLSDFLDATRIQAGTLELRLARRDLREVVREVEELYRPIAAPHKLAIAVPEQPVVARCDLTRIEQVLNNLVSNAIKYSPAGGVVAISLTEEGGEAILAVSDQGIGISPEDRERIFEPFRRTGASREAVPGVGLGLSVARRIVQAHGGRLEVESTPGRGSTFRVRLPLGG